MDIQKEIERRFALQEEYLGTDKPVNKTEPLVSVSVAAYQHVSYIKQCLDGILMQKTDFPFEIIVGEDDSTDGTREICIEYAEKYPDKIRLFLRDRNLSHLKDENGKLIKRLNGVLGFGRMSSRGKYLALCEGDDYWTDPLKLQKQVDILEDNPEYGLCVHNTIVLKDGEEEKKEWRWRDNKQLFDVKDYIYKLFFHTSSALFQKVELPYYALRKDIMQGDIAFFLAVINDKKAFFIDEYMSVYRIHAGGITNSTLHKNRQKAYESLLFIFEGFDEYSNFKYKRLIFLKKQLIKRLIIFFDNNSTFRKRRRAKIEYYFYKTVLRLSI